MQGMETITPTELAKAAGISVPYASQILSGARPASLDIALRIFDSTGVQVGPLANLSKGEIKTARKMVRPNSEQSAA
jgi:plasmid maintenance system antidote protein VapI